MSKKKEVIKKLEPIGEIRGFLMTLHEQHVTASDEETKEEQYTVHHWLGYGYGVKSHKSGRVLFIQYKELIDYAIANGVDNEVS